jgi:type II secretory pathway pseudopilin PulG
MPPQGERGFTILETAIAMVVMMIAALGAVSVFAFAIDNNANAKDRELAMGVAQQQLEQIRSVAFTDATLAATDTSGRTAEITNAERRYTVITTIADSDTVNGQPTLKTIRIRVTPVGTPGSVTLVTHRATIVLGPNR